MVILFLFMDNNYIEVFFMKKCIIIRNEEDIKQLILEQFDDTLEVPKKKKDKVYQNGDTVNEIVKILNHE